nr:appetite-regulating hormone isoform X5 [Saimiri boliviensis boliviensis]
MVKLLTPSAGLLPEQAQRHMKRGGSWLKTLSPPGPPVCNPAEAMPSPKTICSLLLLCVLWLDLAMGGSSFLSPEHQRIQFNAPFDVGIKLSGVQYQQHSQALGKFLQDILWEEAKEAPADK